ncbi:MAG: bifunctional GlcG/HbpS family heme-binding protein/cupin domain-containing protein [Actinomycetota bacterium]
MHRFSIIFAAAIMVLAAVAGRAQVADKKTLTLDGAEKVIAAAKAAAKRLNAPGGVIAVVDDGGNLMALARLDGTFAAGANISIGKARTAALFKKPTKVFEDVIKNGRTSMVALNDFTPLQGGVPIMIDGQLVGAVGVSGAATAAQDEELAIAGANAFNSGRSSASAPVRFFPAKEVDAAFVKGAVLLDGRDGNYMVHASRRDKPGQVEIHNKDADVIHVLDGTATFVTGGKILDPREIAPDEIRGPALEGGQTTQLAKGDVIVVPAGTPHWFKDVQGPFLYYVVKVR